MKAQVKPDRRRTADPMLARVLPEICRPGFDRLSPEEQDAAFWRTFAKWRRQTIANMESQYRRAQRDEDLGRRVERLEKLVLLLVGEALEAWTPAAGPDSRSGEQSDRT